MELVTLKIKCYNYIEAYNIWNKTHPIEYETKYPVDKYMHDIDVLLNELLRHDYPVGNIICKVEVEVLNEDGSYFNNHQFIINIDNGSVYVNDDYMTPIRKFNIGDIVRHFKYKGLTSDEKNANMYTYQIKDFATHTETGEQLVIYQALYYPYKTCARPLDMFMSQIDHEKYPVKEVFRFYKAH